MGWQKIGFKNEADYLADYESVKKSLFDFTSGFIDHSKMELTKSVVSDSVIGVGAGEQGMYYSKMDFFKILEDVVKNDTDENETNEAMLEEHDEDSTKMQFSVDYIRIDIRFFSVTTATINAEININATQNGKTTTSKFIQMASCNKQNGKWMWHMIAAQPVAITADGVESMPFRFADQTLESLRAELQTDTIDLMNKSFSAGIMATYDKENYPLYFANDRFIQMLGYERAEFEDKFRDGTFALKYADPWAQEKEAETQIISANGDMTARFRFAKKDGSPLWVENNIRRTVDGEGNPIYLQVVADVTELVNLQKETDIQNKTMLGSISYARKIQKNLLSRSVEFERAFSDYSIKWKPRDIVGGDMYWLKNFADGALLCVCDCTGHGTPGALLTMLVASAFDTLVNEANYKDTAGVVWMLDRQISSVLNVKTPDEKYDDGIKDGCDLAVLYADKGGSVTISSGNMHVFSCNGREVTKIKGQRISIGEGKMQGKDEVKVVTIPANPNNKFYIASDGLYDQLGGEMRRPFGYKAFKRIILEYHNEKQSVISDKLWETFENHRGKEARRDDVELITFKP